MGKRFLTCPYEKELSGGDDSTTNNRMELTAFIEALRQLKEPCEVRLCSDSQYVINGLQKGWARGWQRRGWKKADGSPALNPDLWAQALEQEARHKITYVWVAEALQQRLGAEYQNEVAKYNKALADSVHNYLAQFNKDKKYAMILAKSGDNILYADKSLDITNEVIKGMNKAYKGMKK